MSDDLDAVLARIDAVKLFRAELERRLEESELDLAGLFDLADRDPVVAGTKILGLVESIPGAGKVRSRRALEGAGIGEAALVESISTDQRRTLLSLLADGPDAATTR